MAKVGPQADRTVHANALTSAEKKAKTSQKHLWKDYIEAVSQEEGEESETKEETSTSDSTPPRNDKDSVKVRFVLLFVVGIMYI